MKVEIVKSSNISILISICLFIAIALTILPGNPSDYSTKVNQLEQRIEALEKQNQDLQKIVSEGNKQMLYYTHPEIIQNRTLDYILKKGEFEGE